MARSGSRASALRGQSTEAEASMWRVLRNRGLGFKFVRQHPVGRYFVDFACREADLVIEIDGSQHIGSPSDGPRTEVIESHGYRVIRFFNNEVLTNLDGVVTNILAALQQPSPRYSNDEGTADATSPPRGEVVATRRVRGPLSQTPLSQTEDDA